MNKNFFHTVWNRTLGCYQAASEFVRNKNGGNPGESVSQSGLFVGLPRLSLMVRSVALACCAMAAIELKAETSENNGIIRGETGFSGMTGEQGKTGDWAGLLDSPRDGLKGGQGGNGWVGGDAWKSASHGQELINSGEIAGGTGGKGGEGGKGGSGGSWGGFWYPGVHYAAGGIGGDGGSGGNGGNGIVVNHDAVVFRNVGRVVGGTGGAGGDGGIGGDGGGGTFDYDIGGSSGPTGASGLVAGDGGYAMLVNGSNSHIINQGQIIGGMNGDAATRALSIKYGAGISNLRLELQRGSTILGAVDASAAYGQKVLALGASDEGDQGTFDVTQISDVYNPTGNTQYIGFSDFQKTGAGIWTLTGATGYTTPWTIYDGTLQIFSDAALGNDLSPLTFGAAGVPIGTTITGGTGRLSLLESTTMRRTLFVNGNGEIEVAAGKKLLSSGEILGGGILRLSGTDGVFSFDPLHARYTGGLTLDHTTLHFEKGAYFKALGNYVQLGGTLSVSPDNTRNSVIEADAAFLDGRLVVDDYRPTDLPLNSSQLAEADRVLISTINGIHGEFSEATHNTPLADYDFLHQNAFRKGNDYVLGLSLAWNAPEGAHGNFTVNSGSFTVDQVLANRSDGMGELTKNGSGTLILSEQNTYDGVTTIGGGALMLSGLGDISQSSAVAIADGATLDVSGIIGGKTQIQNLSGSQFSEIRLGTTELSVNNALDTVFAGEINGSGALNKLGDGTLTLSKATTYTGLTQVAGGTLSAGATDVISHSRGLELSNDAVFRFNDMNQALAEISSTGSGGTIDLGSATLALTGGGLNTATYAGAIIGSGDIVKNGSYTQYLSGDAALANGGNIQINSGVLGLRKITSYELHQPIVLNGGWLDLSETEALGDWRHLVLNAAGADGKGGVIGRGDVVYMPDGEFNASIGAGIDGTGSNGVYVVKNTEGETVLGGSGNTYVGNTRIQAGILTVSDDNLLGDTDISREVIMGGGMLRITGDVVSKRTLQLDAEGKLDITGNYVSEWSGGITGKDGRSGYGITKSGSGTLVLSGVMDYTGDTTITEGTLALAGQADLRHSNLVFADTSDAAVFDISAMAEGGSTINALTDSGTDSIIALGSKTLEVAGGGRFNGTIQDLARSGETGGGLLKTGTNKLELTGINTYTGTTTIAGGMLSLSGQGSIASSSDVHLTTARSVLDISAAADGASVNNLAGVYGSAIELGAQNLEVNQSKDTDFSGNIQGTGGLVKNGDGSLTLRGKTDYTGQTTLNAGKLILDGAGGGAQLISDVVAVAGTELVLRNGASLTGAIDPIDLTIERSGRWNVTRNSQIDTLKLAGLAGFVAPSSIADLGRNLNIRDLQGQDGIIGLYAALGDSDSVSDMLVIDAGGSVTGTTRLRVLNMEGLGAKTTGDGIKVVDVMDGASSDATSFKLAGKVLAGAYDYSLRRGGMSSLDDWFLVSDLRSETSLYAALGNQGLRYGETVLGSLQERRGAPDVLLGQPDGHAWGRLYGQVEYQDATKRSIGRQSDIRGFQVGRDLYAQANGTGHDSAGVYLASGTSVARVEHGQGASSIYAGRNTMRGYSLGAYFTHIDESGSYFDAVFQSTVYRLNSFSANEVSGSTNGYGAAVSLEAGHGFDLGNGYRIEPQAQLIGQNINMRNFSTVDNANVGFDPVTSITTRAGVRWSKSEKLDGERTATGWLSMDLLNTRGPNPATVFFSGSDEADLRFVDQRPGTRVKTSIGMDGQYGKNMKVDLRLSAETSLDASHLTSYGANIGVRWSF